MISKVGVVVRTALLVTVVLATVSSAFGQTPTIRFGLRTHVEGTEEYAAELIREFHALHPEIQVEFQPLQASGYADNVFTLMAAGEAPDVLEVWSSFALEWGENGALLDLSPYVARDISADDIRDFAPALWEAGVLQSGPRNGTRYGVPRYMNVNVLWYNIDMLEAAGLGDINALDDQGGRDFETFLTYATRLTRHHPTGTTQWGVDILRWFPWVLGFGGTDFTYDSESPQYALDSPRAIEALEFLNKLIWRHEVMPPRNAGIQRGRTRFWADGEYAMLDEGTSTVAVAEEAYIQGKFRWDIALAPVLPGGGRPHSMSTDMYGIWSQTEQPEAAWTFLRFLTSKRGAELQTALRGLGPARGSALPIFQQLDPDRRMINHMLAGQHAPRVWDVGRVANGAEVARAINGAVNTSVFNNEAPIQSTLSQLRPVVESLIRIQE